jgi:CubicO group peptidase (beta-lactamase class C family)
MVRGLISAITGGAISTFALSACVSNQAEGLPNPTAIDERARTLMAREDINGMALAVIDAGDVVHVAAYGHRNVERDLLLRTDTIMYGASLTKAAFAYMVMQLVDEGLIDLDRTIDTYLPKPLPQYEDWASLEGDEAWRRLTPRLLLSHQTGLPNLRFTEPDQDLDFHFEPGTRHAYSGEGYYLLQTVLEEGLGLDVKLEMRSRVFVPLAMSRTSMQWREDFAGNLADGYQIDGSFVPHDERSWVSASGSMDTTIADQARLWAAIVGGDGLSKAARAEMTTPQVPIRSASMFPTLSNRTDSRAEGIGFAEGLGVTLFEGPQGEAFSKGGHNPWTGNRVVCIETFERCLVLLGNDVRAERIFPELTRFVLDETGMPWWWAYPAAD